MDQSEQLVALTAILKAHFHKSVWDDSAEDTAKRFLKFLKEYSPNGPKPVDELPFDFTTFEYKGDGQIVIVEGIEFASICAHHLLPFMGTCDVAYIPSKVMVGLSKIPRLVDFHALRPNTQEYLTDAIAVDLKRRLNCLGVAVVMRASHTCMGCRGVRKVNAVTHTSAMRGVFLTNPAARQEMLGLLRRNGNE